jgi:hypothetical protein
MENIKLVDKLFNDLESKDDNIRYIAFKDVLSLTEVKVSWVYDKWFILVDKLSSENSYQRSIGLMLLANLSKSDTENRAYSILDKYLEFFDDEKFITSRQCIQNVWKIAISNELNRIKIIRQLEISYYDNKHLIRHGNLIKQDIISSLFIIFQNTNDKKILDKIRTLIDSEIDDKLVKVLKKIVTSTNPDGLIK